MSKLTEQNLLKKSRFLKYSFLASISVGVVMAMPFEGMASSVLSKSLEELEAHYKAIKEDDYIQRQRNRTKSFGKVGKRPPTRRRASAGGKTTGQNIYGFKPTEQTPQKLEASSPTVSTASNSFVTAPNTPPNTNPKAARKLLFSSEPQPSTPPLLPPRPIAPEIVNNISQIGKMIGDKLAEVTATIQSIVVKKNKKPFQSQQKQLASAQKSIQKLKSKAEKVVEEIKTLVAENTGKNKEKINKLEKELKNIDGLARKIAISANKVVSTQPQKGDPAATQPTLFQLQQREVNKAKENVLNKKIEAASEVKRDIAKNKNFINQRDQAQLEQNQQHIAAAKTKKQQQPEDKQRAEKEKKGKAQDIVNIREDIATVTKIDANIKEILLTSPTPPSTSTIPKQSSTTEQKEQESMLPEDGGYLIPSQVEKPPTFLKILPDEQAAQLKHHKGASLSQESLNLALQKVTSSTSTIPKQSSTTEQKEQESMLPEDGGYLIPSQVEKPPTFLKILPDEQAAQLKHHKGASLSQESLNLALQKVTSSTSTIPKQSSTTEQKEQESMLPEDGGYLIPSQVEKPPTFLKILPDEQAAQLKHHKGASLSQESLNLALQKVTSSTSTIPKQSSTTEQKEQESMLPEDGGYLIPSQVEKPPTFLKILPDEQAAQLKHHKGASLSQESLNLALQKVTSSKEDVEAEYHALRNQKREQNLDVNLDNDLKLTGLAKEHIDLEKKQSRLEQEVQPNIEGHTAYLFNESAYSFPNKPVFSRSPSVSSLNSLSSDEDYVGDIGEDHRYEAEDSCPTPDHLGSTRVNISDENSSETKLALLRTLQMAVMVKRQELEQLPSTRSGADQIAQQINKLKGEEEDIRNVLSGAKTDSSKFDQTFSMAKIEAKLKQYNADFSNASKLASVGSISDLVGSKENLDEEFDKLAESKGLNNESASDISDTEEDEDILAQSLLQEMQEDTEVTDVSRQLSSLPALASSNEYELALSDGREKECLALGDGSEDEESYDSGFEDEEETIEQLSDSEESTPETTAIDTVIPLKQEAMEEVKKNIETTAPTLNQGHKIIKNISNIISTRLDPAEVMATAIAAGDEEETRIKRGLWVRSMYGINNHGRVENINGYRGINKGATIGFDVEIDNNIVGIAYSNVHSVFKFKNNDKEIIDSHVVSIYGQKELPKDFALQALVSASKNFIKDKTTYSYGDNKIRSNVKHRNHSYNAEALLNYSYLLQNKLVITPNIGLRYGKSRDGVYNENGINVQEIVLTMKENNILSGIVGTKVKVPLKDALKFNNLGLTFQGAVEHNFKEKTQRINRVVKIFDNTFKQDYLIPKQPKTSYNLGTGIIGSIKNITISLDYNYYLNKHYRSHQGSVKLKVNL